MPADSVPATLDDRSASSRVVLPWSTCPITLTTAGRGGRAAKDASVTAARPRPLIARRTEQSNERQDQIINKHGTIRIRTLERTSQSRWATLDVRLSLRLSCRAERTLSVGLDRNRSLQAGLRCSQNTRTSVQYSHQYPHTTLDHTR